MWQPRIDREGGAVFRQILEALESDVASGALPAGARLPPQRDLAFRLGVSVGAVTRAYAEAERRGLAHGHVGRGTFIGQPPENAGPFALVTEPAGGVIDLARNRPPPGPAAARIAETLGRLRAAPDVAALMDYSPPAGFDAHRRLIGGWLGEVSGAPLDDWSRLVLTSGAQQAMALAFSAVCRPGDTVFCEAATFQGMKALADHCGYRLVGLGMDAEGLAPEELDRALAGGAGRAVYCLPTLQNPTGRSMGEGRRREIAAIARRHGAWIVEDDVYGGFAEGRTPIVNYAPERTFYIGGASKILAPGLRIGALLAPTRELFDRILRAVRASTYAPPAFGPRIAAQWVEDGTASAIRAELRAETAARLADALAILGQRAERPAETASLHLWLPMSELDAERTAGRALRGGVEVTPPAVCAAPGAPVSGLRVCLGAPTDRATLRTALEVLRTALSAEVDERTAAII